MKKNLFWAVCCLLLVTATHAAEAAEKINAVILSGANNHKWQDTTPVLKEILEQTGRFQVDVVLNPQQLTSQRLATYDVLVSNWNNWGAKDRAGSTWSDALKQAYVGFVKNGGGHVVIHAGSSSFFDWGDYQKICCATWKLGQTGHGPQHEFDVRIAATPHPITENIKGFRTRDELWERPGVQPGVQVLTESYSAATQHWEPSALAGQYGKGRCFALLLGHGPEHMKSASFRTLFARGTEWAATGAVRPRTLKERKR